MRRSAFLAAFLIVAITTLMATTFANPHHTSARAIANTQISSSIQPVGHLVNRRTGQTIQLVAHVRTQRAMVAGKSVVDSTYEFTIPDSIFYAGSGPSPDDSQNLSECDPSCAWVVSLTVYYNTGSDNWPCVSLLSPGYVASWTRNDRSVTVSNAVIHAGMNSYAYCGGVRYGHDQKTVGAPISGQNYNFWPSWGSFNASVNNTEFKYINYYQCGNAEATFTRYGSSWDFTTTQLRAGGLCP